MKKRLYLCTRKNGEVIFKKPEEKYFKKDLVNWKKGYTFAPANEATSSLRNIDNTAQKDLD